MATGLRTITSMVQQFGEDYGKRPIRYFNVSDEQEITEADVRASMNAAIEAGDPWGSFGDYVENMLWECYLEILEG